MTELSSFLTSRPRAIPADKALAHLADLLDELAVYVIDAEGRVVLWNRAAERLLGRPAEEVLGRAAKDALPVRKPVAAIGSCEPAQVDDQPCEVRQRDGRGVRVRRSARALFDADGAYAGAVEILRPEPDVQADEGIAGNSLTETFHGLVTRDPAMKQAFQIIRNVAGTDATVLIRGESGTGKELVARALHEESHRRERPFLAINCAALSPTLLESELFGHVRGAFTGALKDHAGLFKRADGGTLFLDEVAELPLELQAKLLRALQEKTFLPVGADRPVTVDVRIVAATHRSLRDQAKAGRFREDLMYRLRVVPIFLPPLRTRREDIDLLLHRLIERHNAIGPRRVLHIDPEALRLLLDYRWPGNVRELQNVVEYAFAVGRGEVLHLDDLPPEFREEPPEAAPQSVGSLKASDEAGRIREALDRCNGRIDEAARLLAMSRATFWRKRKKYGV